MLKQQTFEIVTDDDYRYFESMEAFMDSGIQAEIISIDCGDEEDFVEGLNYDTHGKVLILIRNLMIKSIPNELGEVIDTISEKCLKKKDDVMKRKARIEMKINEQRKKSKLRREKLFKFACFRSVDLDMKANLVRYMYTSMLITEKEMSEVLFISLLFTLANEII